MRKRTREPIPDDIQKALFQNRQDRKKELQRHRRKEKALSCQGITSRQRKVAWCILKQTGQNAKAASLWLCQQNNFKDKNRLETQQSLEEHCQEWGTEDIMSLMEKEWNALPLLQQLEISAEATVFVKGALAAEWVREQNIKKGFAPPSRLIGERLVSGEGCREPDAAHDHHSPHIFQEVTGTNLHDQRMTNTISKKVQRWRRKWFIRLRRIRGKDDISTAEITAKALE